MDNETESLPTADSENYTLGYGDGAMGWMKARTVEKHGAFMLPWLKPGLQLLDCGCGPGSLTLGFAQRMPGGRAVGVDREPSQFAEAQVYAAEHGVDNVEFLQGDVYQLPYADASFDIVFASAVLGSLARPYAVIEEMYRVLRPSGIIGLKEFDHQGDLFYPLNPVLERSLELYMRIRAHNGHEPAGGRRLKEFLHEVGCEVLSVDASTDQRTTREELMAFVGLNNRLQSEVLEAQYLELGWCQPGEIDEHAKAWEAFARDPRAISISAWIQAVGRKL